MEVDDVFADDMVNLGGRARVASAPPGSHVLPVRLAPFGRGCQVADGRVEPDVPVVPGGIRNLEAEVGGWSGDVPVAEGLAEEVAREVVGNPRIEGAARPRPLGEEAMELFDRHEQVLGRTHLGPRAGERAHRIDQVGRRVGGPTLFAGVAVLVGRAASGAGALHEPVGEEGAGGRVIELLHVAGDHEPALPQCPPDLAAEPTVRGAVGGAVVVEVDLEAGEVGQVSLAHLGDQLPLAAALGAGADHDRRAVRVVGAEIDAVVAAELLEADEDVGLNVLDQMPEMDVAVGVGER